MHSFYIYLGYKLQWITHCRRHLWAVVQTHYIYRPCWTSQIFKNNNIWSYGSFPRFCNAGHRWKRWCRCVLTQAFCTKFKLTTELLFSINLTMIVCEVTLNKCKMQNAKLLLIAGHWWLPLSWLIVGCLDIVDCHIYSSPISFRQSGIHAFLDRNWRPQYFHKRSLF